MDSICCNQKNFQDSALGPGIDTFIQTIEDDNVRNFVGVNVAVNHFIERVYEQLEKLCFRRARKDEYVSLDDLSHTSAELWTGLSKLID